MVEWDCRVLGFRHGPKLNWALWPNFRGKSVSKESDWISFRVPKMSLVSAFTQNVGNLSGQSPAKEEASFPRWSETEKLLLNQKWPPPPPSCSPCGSCFPLSFSDSSELQSAMAAPGARLRFLLHRPLHRHWWSFSEVEESQPRGFSISINISIVTSSPPCGARASEPAPSRPAMAEEEDFWNWRTKSWWASARWIPSRPRALGDSTATSENLPFASSTFLPASSRRSVYCSYPFPNS